MKILLGLCLVLAFSLSISAQTVPSKSGKELKDIDAQITTVESQIKTQLAKKAQLLIRYSEDYKGIVEINAAISKLNEILSALQLKRRQLLEMKLIEELPNNNIQLLKMIIVQNERIIELLEKFLYTSKKIN